MANLQAGPSDGSQGATGQDEGGLDEENDFVQLEIAAAEAQELLAQSHADPT